MEVFISSENTKLGKIPNISLPPGTTCGNVPCKKDCYANNIVKMYSNAKKRWQENLDVYLKNDLFYFGEISRYLYENNSTHFRWHVGGDCPDQDYMIEAHVVAMLNPDVEFLMFTKRFSWVSGPIPKNMHVVLSMWPYLEEPKSSLPKAWVRGDPRTPRETFKCEGICTDCLYCWSHNPKLDILLKGH